MSARLIRSPQAKQDLLEIFVAIGLDNPVAAEKLYDLIEVRLLQLIDYPRLGPRRSDIRPSTRMLVEGPYLILYETNPDTDEGPIDQVEIVRIIYGRRNLTALF